jgi:tungstate transport system ATP-binding protein
VMDGGKIVQAGPPLAVMHHPVNEAVAAFVGMETILRGEVSKSSGGMLEVNINGKDIFVTGAFDPGEKVMCFIRPEQVTVFPDSYEHESSARNVFHGIVVKVQPIGLLFRVHIDCGFMLCAHVTQQAAEDLRLESGKLAAASFKATAVHVIKSPQNPSILT